MRNRSRTKELDDGLLSILKISTIQKEKRKAEYFERIEKEREEEKKRRSEDRQRYKRERQEERERREPDAKQHE